MSTETPEKQPANKYVDEANKYTNLLAALKSSIKKPIA